MYIYMYIYICMYIYTYIDRSLYHSIIPNLTAPKTF